MGTFTRKWMPKERNALKNLTNDAYTMFIKDVANARGLNPKNYKKLADAKVFIVAKAKIELRKMANVTQPAWQKPDMVDEVLKELKASSHISINLENLVGNLK